MRRCVLVNIAAASLVVGAALGVTARQTFARSSQPEPTVWDGVYTAAQARRGFGTFERSCARCHALNADGIPQRFVGDRFWAAWAGGTLDRVHTILQETMPNDAPGSLSEGAYVDVAAFLLEVNDVPAGERELTATLARNVHVTRPDGAHGLPEGAFVAVVGCLVRRDAGGWALSNGSEPLRPTRMDMTGTSGDAASTPLGTRAFDLLYVVAPLDKIAGSRVLVRGLLVRQPADAIDRKSVV